MAMSGSKSKKFGGRTEETDEQLAKELKVSPRRVKELRGLFNGFDADGDGLVTAEEIAETLRSSGHKAKAASIAELLLHSDANGDQLVSFREFLAYALPRLEAAETKERMKETFARFDVDGDGFLSAAELRGAFAHVGETLSLEDAQEIAAQMDRDGDGQVSYKEFVLAWKYL